MASAPLRPCRQPGCPALTRDKYCPKHQPAPIQRKASAAWSSWYRLPIWTRDLRPMQLAREPWCRECARQGRRVRAEEVDHIKPHRGDWALFVAPENHQSLCERCHKSKTMRELNAQKWGKN